MANVCEPLLRRRYGQHAKEADRHGPKGTQPGRGVEWSPRADVALPAHGWGLTPSGVVRVWNVVSPTVPTRKLESRPQGWADGRAGKGCRSKRRPVCNGPDRGSNFAPPRKGADFRRVLDHETEANRLNRCGYFRQCSPLAALKAHRVGRELKPETAQVYRSASRWQLQIVKEGLISPPGASRCPTKA